LVTKNIERLVFALGRIRWQAPSARLVFRISSAQVCTIEHALNSVYVRNKENRETCLLSSIHNLTSGISILATSQVPSGISTLVKLFLFCALVPSPIWYFERRLLADVVTRRILAN